MDFIGQLCENRDKNKKLQNQLKRIISKLALKKLQDKLFSIKLEKLKTNKTELDANFFDASHPFNELLAKDEE